MGAFQKHPEPAGVKVDEGEASTKCRKKKRKSCGGLGESRNDGVISETGPDGCVGQSSKVCRGLPLPRGEDTVLENNHSASCDEDSQAKGNASDAMKETAVLEDVSQDTTTNMDVTREIGSQCASFICGIQASFDQLGNDQCAAASYQAIFDDITSCAKALHDLCEGEQTPYVCRTALLKQNHACMLEVARATAERERAEAELEQALCDRAKAVDDLNRTRAELAAAFPSGGNIAGTFPIAHELREQYCNRSQKLFEIAPEELTDTVALFKLLFNTSSKHCQTVFLESFSGIKGCLKITKDNEMRQVEGLVLKAMRLRRSVIFRASDATLGGWIDGFSDGPISVAVQSIAGGRAKLIKNIQALCQLMGCFRLSRPELHLNTEAIGEEAEFSHKKHQVLDGRAKEGCSCTIIFPSLSQDEELLCKAFVLPSQS